MKKEIIISAFVGIETWLCILVAVNIDFHVCQFDGTDGASHYAF